jgi:uncharacterized membrane protein YozB (DUF420 family)
MSSGVIFQIQSSLILLLIYFGIFKRKQRKTHVKIMSSAMIWDILLILQIELTRGAVAKASEALTNPKILNIHVSLAVSSVVLYGVMVYLGRRVLKGDNEILSLHKKFGLLTVTCRTLTYVTSYLVVTN